MPAMSLVPSMHGKWDNAMSQLSYKMDRPAYSTPPPVENTPSNNECRTVELRGSQVASFSLGCEEYICLPQVFDLFLKHLVGGLHTVYTKLKRLNITPVVCNVEQVRILRGLGAIQPGVNRCKLITRKDFEILYQDCTTASRPGRPPKRYPSLPPTTDMLAHHTNLRGSNSLLNPTDLSAFHKRMRLSHSLEQNNERRASISPVKEDDKDYLCSRSALPADLHSNSTAANLAYLQQAIRQQYQQAAASGLHKSLDAQQINPALAPLMMMSHPGFFPSGIPPTSIAMLNHINQIAQSHAASGAMTSAAVAAAQLAANEGSQHSNAAQSSDSQRGEQSQSPIVQKDSEVEAPTPRNYKNGNGQRDSAGSEEPTSPASSLESIHGSGAENLKAGGDQAHCIDHSFKVCMSSKTNVDDLSEAVKELTKASRIASPTVDDEIKSIGTDGASSMQTLLTNIQGLLKVAADNASLQEKHASIEIAELKQKLRQERHRRHNIERKLTECDKEKAEAEKRFSKERRENQKLNGKIISMQQLIGHEMQSNVDTEAEVPSPLMSPPPSIGVNASDVSSESSTPPASVTSPRSAFPSTSSSFDPTMLTARIAAVVQHAGNQASSPTSSPTSSSAPSVVNNLNNSNNHNADERCSSDYVRRALASDHRSSDLAIDLGVSRHDHPIAQDKKHLFFKNQIFFQPTASQ